MARVDKLKARLDALRALQADPASEATAADLARALGERSCHVVAAAAKHAGQHGLRRLGDAMVAAYARFAGVPFKEDPSCTAKKALVDALSALDHPDPEPFLHAARHVQLEPAFGPPIDTAVPLRCAGLMALVGLSEPSFPWLAGEALADPEPRCRAAAAQCLRAWGDPALAQALLRLRLRAGERDPEVVGDALGTLLAVGGDEGLRFVLQALDGPDGDAAAVALGAARVEEALPRLVAWHDAQVDRRRRRVALVAVGLLRSEAALTWLLGRAATADRFEIEALREALAVFAHHPAAGARIDAALGLTGSDPEA